MPLRPVSELGLSDATDLEPREGEESAAPAFEARAEPPVHPEPPAQGDPPAEPAEPAEPSTVPNLAARRPRISRPRRERRAAPAPREVGETAKRAVALSDEPTVFVQIMAPGELHERLGDTSHALAAEHRKLRHHKTILGALVWRYVQPQDPEALRELGGLLDEYLETEIAEAPAEIKVGAHLPFSLKYTLDGAALALRRTRRAATAKTLLSALIWRHVDPDRLDELVELLGEYREASRPRPVPLG
jgi:hypothetical protein